MISLHSTEVPVQPTTQHASMAISTPPAGLGSIQLITDDAELLLALKELKNSIIGNIWKKVEVADDEGLLQL